MNRELRTAMSTRAKTPLNFSFFLPNPRIQAFLLPILHRDTSAFHARRPGPNILSRIHQDGELCYKRTSNTITDKHPVISSLRLFPLIATHAGCLEFHFCLKRFHCFHAQYVRPETNFTKVFKLILFQSAQTLPIKMIFPFQVTELAHSNNIVFKSTQTLEFHSRYLF